MVEGPGAQLTHYPRGDGAAWTRTRDRQIMSSTSGVAAGPGRVAGVRVGALSCAGNRRVRDPDRDPRPVRGRQLTNSPTAAPATSSCPCGSR